MRVFSSCASFHQVQGDEDAGHNCDSLCQLSVVTANCNVRRIRTLAADVADVRLMVMEQTGPAPPATWRAPSYTPILLGFGIAVTGLVAVYAARRRT
jgi:hypothetical protein